MLFKNKNIFNQRNLLKWESNIRKYRLPILEISKDYLIPTGKGLELGAGSCWLSSTVSQSSEITNIYCIDTNAKKLKIAKDYFIKQFQGNANKLNFLCQDYHQLPFSENSIDFILCDASLHHSKNLSLLLQEMFRVLKPNGFVLAIREPILPKLKPLAIYRKLFFGWQAKLKGDIENIYSLQEWEKYFKQLNFKLTIYKYTLKTTLKEKILNKLSAYNGFLFNRSFFIAKK